MTKNSSPSNSKSRYFAVKLATIFAVGLVFLYSSFWLNSTVHNRKQLLNKAEQDIILAWAGPQTILGPLLIVPYTNAQKKEVQGHMVFLPEQLESSSDAIPEIRRRGIFDVSVYLADLEINCIFSPPEQYKDANKVLHWGQAKLSVCLDDVRGLNSIMLNVNGQEVSVNSGSDVLNNKYPGAHAKLAITNLAAPINIKLHMNIKGADTLNIAPIAKSNKIEIKANWADPSFIGQFLPNTKNVIKKDFQAQWQISSLATSFPSHFDLKENYEEATSFNDSLGVHLSNPKAALFNKSLGVRFLKTADHYQQAERATKYSFLFVFYTFLVFFLFEVVKRTKIHIFQYCITACSLLCFSLLLTAFAEHMSFELAYGISSFAIIAQIAFYAFGLIHKKSERTLFLGLLAGLYAYLFIVLRLEDFALLVGALGMFALITVAMLVTKKISWFEEK